MEWSNIKEDLEDWFIKLFLVIGILAIIYYFVYTYYKNKDNITSSVESSKIDSIIKENDKLIIEVETLDSIKDAKVIEVKSLDNDSTLRLFYQLIGK